MMYLNNVNQICAKSVYRLWLMVLISIAMAGCASEKVIGYGTVTKVNKVDNVNYHPGKSTVVGASSGAAIGAIIGGTTGALLTLGTFGFYAPAIPGTIAAGAAIGGGLGGGGGYVNDITSQGKGLYQFTVHPDERKAQDFIVMQYMQEIIEVDDRVTVYRKDDQLFLKKLKQDIKPTPKG